MSCTPVSIMRDYVRSSRECSNFNSHLFQLTLISCTCISNAHVFCGYGDAGFGQFPNIGKTEQGELNKAVTEGSEVKEIIRCVEKELWLNTHTCSHSNKLGQLFAPRNGRLRRPFP